MDSREQREIAKKKAGIQIFCAFYSNMIIPSYFVFRYCYLEYLDKSPNDKIVLTQGTIFKSTSEQQIHSSSIIQFGQKKGLFSGLNGNPPPLSETISEYITFTKSQIKNLQVEIGEDIVTFGLDDTRSKDDNNR